MTRKIARIQLRRGTSAQWAAADPVLAPGEMGTDTETFESRIGDGVKKWSELPRATDAASNAAQTAADRVQTGMDRVATGEDVTLSRAWAESATPPVGGNSKSSKTWANENEARVAVAVAAATTATTQAGNAATSASEALTSATQAEIAALAAGAPIVTTLTSPVPANGTVELLKLDAGLRVHEVVAGAWVLRGWLVGPKFNTVQALLDDTSTTLGPNGTIVEAGGFRYEVVSTGEHVSTPGGVKLIVQRQDGEYNVKALGAIGNGTTDDTAAWQKAMALARVSPIYAPVGTYVITDTLTYNPTDYVGVFGPGIIVRGDGELRTFIDNRVNGPLFNLITDSTAVLFRGALGALVEGMTIKREVATSGGVGILATAAFNLMLRHVHIIGMSSHGLHLPTILGDNDGSNMVALEHVRIENCAGWGIKADGDDGNNELSFLYMQHTFIQGCGTANAAYQPPSGGMIWKGQILSTNQCAFTLNQNCSLFIKGQAGLGQTVDLQGTTFENNHARDIFCRGISLLKGRNVQFYHNDAFIATTMVEFEAGSFAIRQVDLDGVVVRATAGNNACTAFKISGANADLDTCRVRNVVWDNYDYAGQTRFDGWLFDHVEQCCDIVVGSSTTVLLRPNLAKPKGNVTPLRLRGGGGGTPSTTGEWVERRISQSGLSASNAGLAINTRYYVYLYDNNGVMALEFSTTAFTSDTATGYAIKTGDATRLYVGSVETDGAGAFKTSAGGWLNPLFVPASNPGTYNQVWSDDSNVLRMRAFTVSPTSDTDGVVIGTQV